MGKEKLAIPAAPVPDAFICSVGERASIEAVLLARDLRGAALCVELDYEGRSLKAQMKLANKFGARFAVILGDEELARLSARVREMATGDESIVSLEALASRLSSG